MFYNLTGQALADAIMKHGVKVFNEFRQQHPEWIPDLERACLREARLSGINLSKANLRGVDLSYADLSHANLSGADLRPSTK